MERSSWAVLAVVVATGLGACNSGASVEFSRDPAGSAARISLPGGGELTQDVTITPASPRKQEEFVVRSVVRNTGRHALEPTTAICLLPLGGELSVSEPLILCAGVSMTADLPPGDSVVMERRAFTRSDPGTYRMTVQHLFDPPTVVSLDVTVQP